MLPVNEIICGDCLKVMKDWPDNCVDFAFCDPQYNIALGTKPHSDRQKGYTENKDDLDGYAIFINNVWKSLTRISEVVVITPGNCNQHLWPSPLWTMAWLKMNGCTRTPLTRGVQMNHSCWEPILIYGKLDNPPKFDVVNCPISLQADAKGHPCPKPLRLMKEIISWTNAELIVDGMCGSGSTCVAAKKLNRCYIGIDISEKYCEIARMRLKAVDTGVPVAEQKIGQKGLFENG